MTAIIATSESATIACPFSDRRPVPCGPTADGPLGFGKHAPLTPHVDGVALHAESFGDLDEAHGLAAVHEDHCTESLDICPPCMDNQYMTKTATPSTDHTHGTLCANCGETVERQYAEAQKRTRALYSPRTREHADHLGVLNPAGCWVHLQTGEVVC